MKAGHSKLDGYSLTLPAMRPSPRLPTVIAPLPFAVLAPPPARLLIALLFPPLLRLLIRFLRHRPWHLLPMAPPPKPVVQLLVRNLHPQFLLTPGHRLPYCPKPFFRCYLPQPLRLLCPPCLPMRLSIASIGLAYPLQTLRLMPPNSLLNRLVAYPHYRFHPLQTLALSRQPQCLPPPCYLGLFSFSVKLVKRFCRMLPCNLQGTDHTDLL